MGKKKTPSIVFRNGRQCFSQAAGLPEGCATHPEDPLVLIVDRENPKTIAKALWTEGVKAVILRTGEVSDNVQTLRTRMTDCSYGKALKIGQYALGERLTDDNPSLQEMAELSLKVRRQEQKRLSALFQSVASKDPELGAVLYRPIPQDSSRPDGYGFHDDSHVTLAAIQIVHGTGTPWIQGYQHPEDVQSRKITRSPRFYNYGHPDNPDDRVTILRAEEGDTLFFFGRDACAANPAFPAFVHSSPPIGKIPSGTEPANSRLVLASYTKKPLEFPRHLLP